MLKAEITFIIVLILIIMDGNIPPLLSAFLAFSAGLSLKTLPDLLNNLITIKSFIIRIIQISGLVTIGVLYWTNHEVNIKIEWYIFGVTLFAETIIFFGFKAGNTIIKKHFKKLEDE